jgi:hypothetical protein
MKHIFRSLITVVLLAATLSACDFRPYVIVNLSQDIRVSTDEITLESTGLVPASFTVSTTGDWIIVAPEELTISPKYGHGPATVTVSAPDNVDEVWHEVQGPRTFKISVCGTDTTLPITVNQKGEAGLDASRTYSKITKLEDFEDGKGYLIVTKTPGGSFVACGQVPASKNYGWPSLVPVEGTDDVFVLPDAGKALTFIGTADAFRVRQADGRFWYQTGTFTSFNVTADPATEGTLFKLSFAEDGTVRIVNIAMEKTLQCSMKAAGASYDEYLSDAGLGDGCAWPSLYKDSKVATDEVLTVADVTVDASATSVDIPVTSNAATGWRVRCHDSWVQSFTPSGNGNGTIHVTFDANTSYDAAREAEIMVLGETTGVTVRLTQSKFVPSFTVVPETLSAAASATSASFSVKANTPWTVTCPSGVSASPSEGTGDATVTLSFAANTGETDLTYTIKVSGSDSHLEVKERTVTLTHKSNVGKTLPYGEAFDSAFGDFTLNDVSLPSGSTYVWTIDTKNKCAKASSYFSGTNHASESWLVSPVIDLSEVKGAQVSFQFAMNYGTPALYPEAFYGYVIEGTAKTKVEFKGIPAKGSWTWIDETVDLSAWAGKKIQFAFVYVSTDAAACTAEVKNVSFDVKSFSAAEILAAAKDTEVLMKDAIVTMVYGKGFMVQDKTGSHVLVYPNAAPPVTAGDRIDVSGKVGVYSNMNQIANPIEVKVLSSGNTITWPTLSTPTAAEVDAFTNAAPGYMFAKVTVKLDSSKNYEGKMEGGSVTVNIQYDNALTKPDKGATVTVTGYFYGFNNNKAYFYATLVE